MQHSDLNEWIKEWKNNTITKTMLKKLQSERLDSMETTLNTSGEDSQKHIGITLGITNAMNTILSLEEGDIDDFIGD